MALFVCTLVLSMSISAGKKRVEEERDAANGVVTGLNSRIRALEDELARQTRCPQADEFLGDLEQCLSALGVRVTRGLCSIAIGEDFIKFGTLESDPRGVYEANARSLAGCLGSSSLLFARERPQDFASIEAIFIDGHTDCVGEHSLNTTLGAARASALYRYLLSELETSPDAERVLPTLAIRSFGETKPTPGSSCGSTGSADDRRVEVSVQLRLQNSAHAPVD